MNTNEYPSGTGTETWDGDILHYRARHFAVTCIQWADDHGPWGNAVDGREIGNRINSRMVRISSKNTDTREYELN